jgi:maltooligosyltrehalose trehalohydrolase
LLSRRFPIGAELVHDQGTHFRVWAPACRQVAVVERQSGSQMPGKAYVLKPEAGGYHAGLVESLQAGSLYSLRLDEAETLFPDPASRFQPEGPHGPSQVVDPHAYRWNDTGFTGLRHTGQVIYELHMGTFTREGTYRAAGEQLSELRHLGITTIELMPLADFPGRFGWGYDGVDLWAPTRLYGTPEELCQFVDTAHTHGLGVILDVVYNHLGPDGNYLKAFSPDYFTDRYENEWGEPINFDGQNNGPVREFFVQNARYWIEEYHLDGLRLDATQSIFDASALHVIAESPRPPETPGAPSARTCSLWRKTSRRKRRSCGHARPVATVVMPSGTTTFTTAPEWRLPGGAKPTTTIIAARRRS